MTSVPYAPKLFEPGSQYVMSGNILNFYSYESWATDKAQLVSYAGDTRRKLVSGPMKLVSENLRNLSQALTDRGVRVKAWSFHSGVLPGAEMMYVGTGELDDLLTVTEAPSIGDESAKRFNQLQEAGLLYKDKYGGLYADSKSVYLARLSEAYIVDDWTLLTNEMESRWRAEGRPNAAYATTDRAAAGFISLDTSIFAANVDPSSSFGLSIGEQTELKAYEGYRQTALVDIDLLYGYTDHKLRLEAIKDQDAREMGDKLIAMLARDRAKSGIPTKRPAVHSRLIEEA